MDRYLKLEKLGEGTYGTVYKAVDKATGNLVALRTMELEMGERGVPTIAMRELELVRLLSESNYFVRLLRTDHALEEGKLKLYLMFEYLDSDLKKFIYSPRWVTDPQVVKRYLYQLCKGVALCHRNGMIHGDLRPRNILVNDQKGTLKIAHEVKGLGSASTHKVAPLWYKAPELLLNAAPYSIAADVWAVGCIFAEMVTRRVLFPGDWTGLQLRQIFRLLGTPTESQLPGVGVLVDRHQFPKWDPEPLETVFPSLDPDGVDLLSRMLKYVPAFRIPAKAALEHAFFDDLDKSHF